MEEDGKTFHLFAQWRQPDAIVRFDAQGGSAVTQKEYGIGDKFGDLSESHRSGYTFMGWFTEPDGKGKPDDETDSETERNEVIESCTLYAYWKLMPEITLKPNGGSIFGETKDHYIVCDYGKTLGEVPTPSKQYSAFYGWYSDTTGDLIDVDKPMTESETFTARWGYRPKFETNGGSYLKYPDENDNIVYESPDYEISDNPNYPIGILPVVERANHTFAGWYRQVGDTELKVEDNQTVNLATGDVFKAHWNENDICSVRLYNDGSAYGTIKVYKNHAIGELPTPAKSGYDFVGWFDETDSWTDENDEVQYREYTYSSHIPRDLTLTAHWRAFIPLNSTPNSVLYSDLTARTRLR